MPLRILAINWQDSRNPLAGGAEVHLQEILSRLGGWGHEVTLLCCGFEGAAAEERYDNLRVVRRGKRAYFNWIAPAAARKLLESQTFDIVLEDINKIPIYTPRFCRAPLLAIVPHLFATTVFHEINVFLASYIYVMERPVRHYYRNVPFIVISQSTKNDLVGRGIAADLIRVVHCGIDHVVYCPDPTQQKSADPLLTYVGRLKKYKSVDHLLAAAALLTTEFPKLQVEIVGAGDDDVRLHRRAAALRVADRVRFTGYVPEATKVGIIRRSWGVVCPSLKEGWGLTNIEANACGTPVVCSDVPGLRDSARDGETGLLYPYGDVAALADRLRRLLADAPLRERLTAGGLQWAQQFHWDDTARETEAICARVIRGDRQIGRPMTTPSSAPGAGSSIPGERHAT